MKTIVGYELIMQEEKWEEKAVKSLSRKLRTRAQLDELAQAIANEDAHSPCIAIPRYG